MKRGCMPLNFSSLLIEPSKIFPFFAVFVFNFWAIERSVQTSNSELVVQAKELEGDAFCMRKHNYYLNGVKNFPAITKFSLRSSEFA